MIKLGVSLALLKPATSNPELFCENNTKSYFKIHILIRNIHFPPSNDASLNEVLLNVSSFNLMYNHAVISHLRLTFPPVKVCSDYSLCSNYTHTH